MTPATVSRVLNQKQRFSTSQEVRDRILATADKIGYVPNLAARNLNRGMTKIVGVFASPLTHIGEGINESLLEGMRSVMHAAGYDVFFELSARSPRSHALPSWRFDGALLMQAPTAEAVAELERRRVPFVAVNEIVPNAVASILADDPMGTMQAVEHFASLGHRKIAYANARATYFNHYSQTERYETLVRAVKKYGMELAPGHDQPFGSPHEFLEHSVLRNGATGVLTYDHQIGVLISGAAANLGLKIPQECSLICFNDVYPVAIMPTPLTAVAVSGEEMGRIGADLLLKRLTSEKLRAKAHPIRVPESLVIRASTAPPRGKEL